MAGILLENSSVSDSERAAFAIKLASENRRKARELASRLEAEREGLVAAADQVDGRVLGRETVAAGGYLAAKVAKGELVRIVDLHGQQAVDFLCYDLDDFSNRYNAANTIKINRSIYIGKGFRLFSDYGQVLMTIVEDTIGSHDTIGGCCSAAMNLLRYGVKDTPNCRDNFLSALQPYGLGSRDIPANLNFFMRVPVAASGEAEISEGVSRPGDYVELRADRDVLVAISNCPQIFNPCNGWNPTPIRFIRWASEQ